MDNKISYKELEITIINKYKNIIERNTPNLSIDEFEEILFDAYSEYESIINEEIIKLYNCDNLNPEVYELELYINKVSNREIRNKINMYFLELELLRETIDKISSDFEEKKEKSVGEVIEKIDEDKRKEVITLIDYYEKLYGDKLEFVSSGETCDVYSVGNKIVKFGALRRYQEIPYCLNIESLTQYDKYNYVYVTDKLDTENINEEDAHNMYYNLRDKGYVWVDVKKDNLGSLNGELKILDDIDIYLLEDVAKLGKKSVLEFVSYNSNLALLELNYLRKNDINFDINNLQQYFNNQSTQIQELITGLKDKYLMRENLYKADYENIGLLFENILKNKLEEKSIQR